ncbi:uncharacterized protein GVI51_J06171 [Nakaseomyces glabratus]|uniref:Cyclin N-terminal domain-containing protein n=2 Tax=Candida glabrata TaxID=5478 RepID=Q6FP62_CANGA|nr:uncharacterized protein CAGL0J06336g [Nakaseomyces glabratus]KAH7598400.1 Cyclin, N-terminal domain [Nakaseomyces glabratus]KAH7603829.1 Cyclin, N-terminal domain [Nakaseomyces glabratus]KAI8395393.1 Cyclin, N-terminal domain [Nakaseomyces glabratus]KAJ9571889.1 hypothetical protein LTX96_0001429 [Nakaseomyces glabratus]KTA98187.1 PHO85 cyclin-9 [Nakaseomyces glabratus]|eukprot:XP_447982.1 uncharacterized protein CAGL0J06336g [[Candida] glabrata]
MFETPPYCGLNPVEYEILVRFLKRNVTYEMLTFLISKTNSMIKIKKTNSPKPVELSLFVEELVASSKVQASTLMATAVYLDRLSRIIPSNVCGIETTKHRMFLGCLILSSKSLDDSSLFNKHWTKYCNGLLTLKEVNSIERELLSYFNWDINIQIEELYNTLEPILKPIREEMVTRRYTLYLPTPSSSPGKIDGRIKLSSHPVLQKQIAEEISTYLDDASPVSSISTFYDSESPTSMQSGHNGRLYLCDNCSTPALGNSTVSSEYVLDSSNQRKRGHSSDLKSTKSEEEESNLEYLFKRDKKLVRWNNRWSMVF